MADEELQNILIQFDAEFDQLCVDAVNGKELEFLEQDNIGEVLANLVSLGNAVRHTFMKIRYLQYKLAKEGKEKLDLNLEKDFKKEM